MPLRTLRDTFFLSDTRLLEFWLSAATLVWSGWMLRVFMADGHPALERVLSSMWVAVMSTRSSCEPLSAKRRLNRDRDRSAVYMAFTPQVLR